MKTLNQALLELEALIDNNLSSYNIPYKKGNVIRTGKMLIRQSKKHGYIVFDTATNKQVTTTFSQHGALAIAKACNDDQRIDKLLNIDQNVQKHYNDALFYSHGIKTTTNDIKRLVLEDRLDISADNLRCAYNSLERFIMAVES